MLYKGVSKNKHPAYNNHALEKIKKEGSVDTNPWNVITLPRVKALISV